MTRHVEVSRPDSTDDYAHTLFIKARKVFPGGRHWQEIASADGAQRLLLSPTRLYDPALGIFLSKDPLLVGNPARAGGRIEKYRLPWNASRGWPRRRGQVLAAYSFASANPILLKDAVGLDVKEYPLKNEGNFAGEVIVEVEGSSLCAWPSPGTIVASITIRANDKGVGDPQQGALLVNRKPIKVKKEQGTPDQDIFSGDYIEDRPVCPEGPQSGEIIFSLVYKNDPEDMTITGIFQQIPIKWSYECKDKGECCEEKTPLTIEFGKMDEDAGYNLPLPPPKPPTFTPQGGIR